MASPFKTLNVDDYVKSIITAILAAIVSGASVSVLLLLNVLQNGGALTRSNVLIIVLSGVSAGLGYLAKNYFSNSQGDIFTSEDKTA